MPRVFVVPVQENDSFHLAETLRLKGVSLVCHRLWEVRFLQPIFYKQEGKQVCL